MSEFSAIIVALAAKQFGEVWIKAFKDAANRHAWTFETVARLLLAMPDDQVTWKLVAAFGSDAEAAFWRLKHSYAISGPVEDLLFVISKYLSAGRPTAAIEAAFRRLPDVSSRQLLELLDAAVIEINRATEVPLGQMFTFYVEKVFETLELFPKLA